MLLLYAPNGNASRFCAYLVRGDTWVFASLNSATAAKMFNLLLIFWFSIFRPGTSSSSRVAAFRGRREDWYCRS